MFKDFGRRLQRDVKRSVDNRLKISEDLSQGRIKVGVRTYVHVHMHMLMYSVSVLK